VLEAQGAAGVEAAWPGRTARIGQRGRAQPETVPAGGEAAGQTVRAKRSKRYTKVQPAWNPQVQYARLKGQRAGSGYRAWP